MKIEYTGRHVDVSPAIRKHVEGHFKKLELPEEHRFWPEGKPMSEEHEGKQQAEDEADLRRVEAARAKNKHEGDKKQRNQPQVVSPEGRWAGEPNRHAFGENPGPVKPKKIAVNSTVNGN